jgi:transcriptional regulator with XRE-family HTH domain
MTHGMPRNATAPFDQIDRMKKAAEAAGMTGADIAAALGVAQSTVSHWMARRYPPKQSSVMAWAMATGADYIWLRDGDPWMASLTKMFAVYDELAATAEKVSGGAAIRKLVDRQRAMVAPIVALVEDAQKATAGIRTISAQTDGLRKVQERTREASKKLARLEGFEPPTFWTGAPRRRHQRRRAQLRAVPVTIPTPVAA